MVKQTVDLLKELFVLKKYSFLSLTLALILLPLSINLSSFFIFVAIGLKLIEVIFFKQTLHCNNVLKISSALGLMFIIYILGNSIFQAGLTQTALVFDKQFSHWLLMLIIPSILYIKRFNILLIRGLVFGSLFSIIVVSLTAIFFRHNFNNVLFQEVLDIHHTYLSTYLLFLMGLLLVLFHTQKKGVSRNRNLFYVALIVLIIILITSKIAIIIASILLMINVLVKLIKKRQGKYLLFLPTILIIIFLFKNYTNVSFEKALDFRLFLWDEAVRSINENILFGNLLYEEKGILNYKHYVSGRYYFMDSNFNSHNQYLSLILKYGILGFILFFSSIYLLCQKLKFSISSLEPLSFLIIISLVFVTENFLDRHHGIVFYSIFLNYYLVFTHEKT